MPDPLIRFDLDAAVQAAYRGDIANIRREFPDHVQPLVFRAECHPEWPTWSRYEDGVIIITCSQDETEVARVEVAQ